MSDDVIQDLKQFITATVSQQAVSIKDDIKALDNKLIRKIDDLSDSVAEAIENTNEAADTQLTNHETRITHLEQKTT